jgi:hypothetical protein
MDNADASGMAADLFRMLEHARRQGLDICRGFRNHAVASPRLDITYLFLPQSDLARVPAFPASLRRWVRRTNVLVCIEAKRPHGNRRTIGVHLLWATDTPLSAVQRPEQIAAELVPPGVQAYAEQLRHLFRSAPPQP